MVGDKNDHENHVLMYPKRGRGKGGIRSIKIKIMYQNVLCPKKFLRSQHNVFFVKIGDISLNSYVCHHNKHNILLRKNVSNKRLLIPSHISFIN